MNTIKHFSLLIGSFLIIIIFSFFLILQTEYSYHLIESLSVFVRFYFGKYYLFLGFLCVIIVVLFAILPTGNIRLGTKGEKPIYSMLEWMAMLYSAGMGAGILLRAVQEPVYMKLHPPIQNEIAPNIIALEYVFYHWGFTAWAFYALFAIIIGFYLYKQNAPVVISSAFNGMGTLIKNEQIVFNTLWVIDILCIFTTVVGLVAAVGLGTTQISGGLTYLTNISFSLPFVIGIVMLISLIAGYSAYIGVTRGIKIISKYNIYCTIFLLLFVFFQGNIVSIAGDFCLALYYYITDFIFLSLAIGKFDPGEAFLTEWTYYYWAFWLAWAPFTGIFIARISRGRTLRELALGVLFIPSLGTFFWFSAFGSSAFQFIETMEIYDGKYDNVFTSIYFFFSQYPFQTFMNALTVVLLISFLVTSLDSAIFVLSMFTDHGYQNPNKKHRILWGFALTLFTIGIIILGSVKENSDVLVAMQKLLIVTSLPFSLLLIVMLLLFIRTVYNYKKQEA